MNVSVERQLRDLLGLKERQLGDLLPAPPHAVDVGRLPGPVEALPALVEERPLERQLEGGREAFEAEAVRGPVRGREAGPAGVAPGAPGLVPGEDLLDGEAADGGDVRRGARRLGRRLLARRQDDGERAVRGREREAGRPGSREVEAARAARGEVEDLGRRIGGRVELEDERAAGTGRPRRRRPSGGRRPRDRFPSRGAGRRAPSRPAFARARLRPSRFTSPARRVPSRSRRGTPVTSASGAATTGASTSEKRAARSRSAPASGSLWRRDEKRPREREAVRRLADGGGRRRGVVEVEAEEVDERGRLLREELLRLRAGRGRRPAAGGRGPRSATRGFGTARSRRPSSGGSAGTGRRPRGRGRRGRRGRLPAPPRGGLRGPGRGNRP